MTKRRSVRFTAAMAVAAALLSTSQLAGQAGQKAPAAPKPARMERGEGGPKPGEWDTAFRALPAAANIRSYDERLSARPHHVGSAYGKENAEWMLARFKEWGWDAAIERFDVLFPTPKERVLEMVSPSRFVAKLEEPAVAVDPTSSQKSEQLPTYNAYSTDGDVTARLVYVNLS
jgi:N-acetylated-alpha-linked acidic dipeptidase